MGVSVMGIRTFSPSTEGGSCMIASTPYRRFQIHRQGSAHKNRVQILKQTCEMSCSSSRVLLTPWNPELFWTPWREMERRRKVRFQRRTARRYERRTVNCTSWPPLSLGPVNTKAMQAVYTRERKKIEGTRRSRRVDLPRLSIKRNEWFFLRRNEL